MANRAMRSVGNMVLLIYIQASELHKSLGSMLVLLQHNYEIHSVSKLVTWVQLPLTTLPTLARLKTKRKKLAKIFQS